MKKYCFSFLFSSRRWIVVGQAEKVMFNLELCKDLEANRMTLKWILLLFSKIKKQHHHLGTKIRKLKGKRKSWQLKNITSIFFCYVIQDG